MMRSFFVLVCFAFMLPGCLAKQPRPDELKFPSLEFKLPEVVKLSTVNGALIYLQEDFELPLVEVTAVVPGGSLNDPVEKVGLASVFASSLRAGGAGDYTPQELDEALERLAINLSVSASKGAVTINMSLLKEDLSIGFEILGDLLRRPRFDEARFELVRSQMREGIRRRNDEPSSVASRNLRAAVYGDHPLGREATLNSIDNISRADLLAHYRRFFHPNNLRLAVSGAIKRNELVGHFESYLGDWFKQDFRAQQVPEVGSSLPAQLWLIEKDIPQTTVLMGHVGLKRTDPDFFPVRVMNYILGGGGFNSRLMREVRSNRGLAYSVYSYYTGGQILPGMFLAGCETRNGAVLETVQLIKSLMAQIRDEPVSDAELALAKESIINSFVFAFEDSHDVVARSLNLELYGYPDDYLQRYRERISTVSASDVQRVARKYLRPEDLQLVLVGNPREFAAPPESLGLPVVEVEASPDD